MSMWYACAHPIGQKWSGRRSSTCQDSACNSTVIVNSRSIEELSTPEWDRLRRRGCEFNITRNMTCVMLSTDFFTFIAIISTPCSVIMWCLLWPLQCEISCRKNINIIGSFTRQPISISWYATKGYGKGSVRINGKLASGVVTRGMGANAPPLFARDFRISDCDKHFSSQ